MGSHKSPPYASLAVGFIEKEAYEFFKVNKGSDYAEYFIKMLRRFLDDVFIKWRNSLGDPMEHYNLLNSTDVRRGASGTSRDVPIFVQFYKKNQNSYT